MSARLEELRTRFQENPRRYFAPYANELRKSGDATQAIAICRTHLTGQPGHVSGHIVLGQALHEAGESAEARQAFTSALELDPENFIALRTMGEISYANGELADARHWYERLLDADPRNTEVSQLLADLANVPQPVVRPPAESFSAPVLMEPSPEAAPPLPAVGQSAPDFAPPAPVFGADPEEFEVIDPPATTSSATPARAIDTGFVVEDVEMFAPSSDEAVAAPEPLALSNPVEDFVAESRGDGLLEIEDMDAFLSPTSSQAIEPEAIEATGEAIVTAAESVTPDGPVAHVEQVEVVSAFEVAAPPEALAEAVPPVDSIDHESLGADAPDEWTSDELLAPAAEAPAPDEWKHNEVGAPVAEAPAPDELEFAEPVVMSAEQETGDAAADFVVEPFVAEVIEASGEYTEPVLVESAAQPTADASIEDAPFDAVEVDVPSAEASPEPTVAEVDVEDAGPVADVEVTSTAVELPDEWTLPPSMDAFEAAQASAPAASPEQPEAIDVDVPTAEAPDDTSPQATFAENGFEGSAHEMERLSWMTPGAAEHSDPEAAPDWFAEEDVEAEPVSEPMEPVEADSEPEPVTAQAGDDDWFAGDEPAAVETQAEDDWFEEPVAESVPVVSAAEDLYLAPDLAVLGAAPVGFEMSTPDVVQPEPVVAESTQPEPVSASVDHAAPDDVAAAPVVAASTPAEEPLLPLREDFPQPAVALTPRYTPAVGSEPPRPAPFVTETLAELYVQQGFRDEALAIYRQLSERDPADSSLQERVAALEAGITPPVAAAPDESVENRDRGQSVRAFFGAFARRTPSATAVEARLERNATAPAVDPVSGEAKPAESSFAAAASALANLFPASRPPSADEGAASKLAGAINESQPGGRPSRTAERELSLDHLFRDVPASAASGMMLDEFYAPPSDSSGPATGPDEATGTPDEGEADIRQFTAWLEGLRKK